MLHQAKNTVLGGYGDLFRVLSDLEKMDKTTLLLGQQKFNTAGIPELMKIILPKCNLLFTKRNTSNLLNLVSKHKCIVNRTNYKERTFLSERAVKRINPFHCYHKYVVVHPYTRGISRQFKNWSQINFGNVNYKIVGGSDDPILLKGDLFNGDLLDVCRLLLGSVGLICVDSCVLHLANALQVPSIALYSDEHQSELVPNHGKRMYLNDDVELISKEIYSLYEN